MSEWFSVYISFLIAFAILGIDGRRPIPCYFASMTRRERTQIEILEDEIAARIENNHGRRCQ